MCCCQNFKTQYKNKIRFYLKDKEKDKTDKSKKRRITSEKKDDN